MMNQNLQWKLAAGFLLVFIAGGTTGAFFAASRAHHGFFDQPHDMIAERMRDRLRVELQLTPEQVEKIAPIIDKTATELEKAHRETRRLVHEVFVESHRAMAAHLTPEQQAKLRGLENRHQRWMHHRRGLHRSPVPVYERE